MGAGSLGFSCGWVASVGLLYLAACFGGGPGLKEVGSIPLYEESWACVRDGLVERGYGVRSDSTGERGLLQAFRGGAKIVVEEIQNELGTPVLRFSVQEAAWEPEPYVGPPVEGNDRRPRPPPTPPPSFNPVEAEGDALAVGSACTPV